MKSCCPGPNFTHLFLVVVVRRRRRGGFNAPHSHGHSLSDRDPPAGSRAALLDGFHLDKSVLWRHVLDIRRPHGVEAGAEADASAGSVGVLEVHVLLDFVGGEDVRLSGTLEARGGACLLEARRRGNTGEAVPVVRLRRRRRGRFGSFES